MSVFLSKITKLFCVARFIFFRNRTCPTSRTRPIPISMPAVFLLKCICISSEKCKPKKKTGMLNNNNNQRFLTRVTLDSVSTEKLVTLDPNNYYNKNKYILKYLSYLQVYLLAVKYLQHIWRVRNVQIYNHYDEHSVMFQCSIVTLNSYCGCSRRKKLRVFMNTKYLYSFS